MNLTLGFSPCPNDTFIFDALVNKKIDTGGLNFDVTLEDVETLNQWAISGKLDITKLSFGVLPIVFERYIVLNSGSALGKGVGPLLISKQEQGILNVEQNTIAIPGENTTAHLLFSLAYPGAKNKVFLRYNEIENFILEGKGLGVIIHENRFTYTDKGLHKITDLGDYWEKETGHSIPLGGIVIRRTVDSSIARQVDRLIKQSIDYAYLNHYDKLATYVKEYSQEMSEAIMRKHIDLYVNEHSNTLGNTGKAAVQKLLTVFQNTYSHYSLPDRDIFLSEDN